MKLSIIIANHNYRDYVGAAIESALAVDWPDKEIIVVDDASTDDSRTIIESFTDRVAAYFRPKSNQLGAHIFGFGSSTGDVIIFLDSDDLLEPEVMQEVAKVWRPGVSKVQFRMNVIDATGAQLGSAFPQFSTNDDPTELRRTYLRTMTYTTPPGSGNAYSRDFVRSAFAFGSTIPQSDAVLLTLAPILGDVLTIRKPLARYRVHDASYGAMPSVSVSQLRKFLDQDAQKAHLFAIASRQLELSVPSDPLRYSLSHLQYRFASYLVEPSTHPFREDTKWGLVYRLIDAVAKYSQMRPRNRAILIIWAIACALAPQYSRSNLILWRLTAASRPPALRLFLDAISSLRSPRLPDRPEIHH
jgi:glycosyltransferase involved in cell wall biosynthesis